MESEPPTVSAPPHQVPAFPSQTDRTAGVDSEVVWSPRMSTLLASHLMQAGGSRGAGFGVGT